MTEMKSKGIVSIVYPTKDIAKATFTKFLGVQPHVDSPYYVGFKVGAQEIGLDPNGHEEGARAYYDVPDIKHALQLLVEAGAQILQDVKDVGGGASIASVRDTDGNLIGLMQQSP